MKKMALKRHTRNIFLRFCSSLPIMLYVYPRFNIYLYHAWSVNHIWVFHKWQHTSFVSGTEDLSSISNIIDWFAIKMRYICLVNKACELYDFNILKSQQRLWQLCWSVSKCFHRYHILTTEQIIQYIQFMNVGNNVKFSFVLYNEFKPSHQLTP